MQVPPRPSDDEVTELMVQAAADGGNTADAVNAVNSFEQRLTLAGLLNPSLGQMPYWVDGCRCTIGPFGLTLHGCPEHTGQPTPTTIGAMALVAQLEHSTTPDLVLQARQYLSFMAGQIEGMERRLSALLSTQTAATDRASDKVVRDA